MPIASICQARSRRSARPDPGQPRPATGTSQPATRRATSRPSAAASSSADAQASTHDRADQPRPGRPTRALGPSAVGDRRRPRPPDPARRRRGRWRSRARRPAATAAGTRSAKTGRQGAGRPEPAEDRQDRDPDRERQPRPGRSLEPEVVGKADRRRRRRPGTTVAGPDGIDRTSPAPKAATATSARDRPRDEARGDRLARLVPGVARRVDEVVVAPIPNWSAVIASPSRTASIRRRRRRRAATAPRRRGRRGATERDG